MSISNRGLTMKHSETATHTIARIARCKDCGNFTKVTRNARWHMGWEQVQLDKPVQVFMGVPTTWVDARGKHAGIKCGTCASTHTSARTIVGVHSDRIECGPKCQSAKGPSCECRCDGENHGSMYA